MRPVTLAAGRLLLRPPRPGDATAVLQACQDPQIARWTSVPSPYREQDARAWVEREAPAGWAADTHLVWYACPADDPATLLASVGLHHLDLSAGTGEIGYWAAPQARRAGITTAAVDAVSRFGIEHLGLDRIEWTAAVGNTGSRRVAERAGFRVEATARERLVLHGRREDAWVGGLLPGDLPPRSVDLQVSPGSQHGSSDEDPLAPAADGPAGADWEPVRGVEITAGSLHLRPWREADAPVVAALLADPDLAQWNPISRSGTPAEDADRFVVRALDTDPTHVSFAVADATTGQVLGHLALHHLDLDAGHGELGFWTVPAARGRGVARRAVGAGSRWAFGALGLRRLELFHAVGNAASCRVATSAGFAHEGTLRSSYRYGDGRRHDEHLHARLSSDGPIA